MQKMIPCEKLFTVILLDIRQFTSRALALVFVKIVQGMYEYRIIFEFVEVIEVNR